MRNKYERVASMFLTLMLIMGIIGNFCANDVAAALTGNQEVGVIFAYGGNHGDITLQGGWHKGASNNRFAVWYTKADRRVMYCLEPGNPRANDSAATSRDVNYIRNGISNRFLSGTQIEQFIGYIMAYGYTGTIDGGADVRYLGYFADPIRDSGASTTTQLYEACQILIWETVVGERDANFNYVPPESGYTPCKAIHTTDGDTGNVFETYYQSIANSVKNYGSIPNFLAPTLRNAYDMPAATKGDDGFYWFDDFGNVDMSDWALSVVDRNGNPIDNCNVSRVNGKVRVYIPRTLTEAYLYGVNRICGSGVVAWSSDGVWGAGSTSQDLVQTGFADPVQGYCKIKESSGTISVHKESDYGVVSGIRFNLYYRGDGATPATNRIDEYGIYTDDSGNGSMSGLPFGWYEIEEIKPQYTRSEITADRFDPVTNNPIFRVVEGSNEEVTVNATNYVDAVIRINKVDKVTGEAIGFTSFSLYLDANANGNIDEDEYDSEIIVRDDDGDGIIEFEGLGIGDYLIKEYETQSPYTLSDEVIPVRIETPNVYDYTYENDAFGTVSLTKVDSSNPDVVLTDAVFSVYRDVNENGIYDESDTYVFNIVDDDEDGNYVSGTLERGCYLINEVVAPEGYELDPEFYPFEITLEELDTRVGNCLSGLFENSNGIYGTMFMSSEDSDLRVVPYGEDITLIDNVMYSSLIPGEAYVIKLTLIDGETGEAILDEEGNELTVYHEFYPENTDGVYGAAIRIDSTVLGGRTIVAFERLYRAGRLVGTHEDVNSEDQTLVVPVIGTTATASDGESKTVVQSENTAIVDSVAYENLTPGREYQVVGVVMDRTTGRVFHDNITTSSASTVFTPDSESNIVEVEFTINTVNFVGDLVVFEEVYDVETGLLIAVHRDINYEGQTVSVKAEDTPTPTPTATTTPGIPRTGETASSSMKYTIAGTVVVGISIIILGKYYSGFRKED